MKKKTLCLALATLLAATAVFSGCGNTADSGASADSAPASAPTVETASDNAADNTADDAADDAADQAVGDASQAPAAFNPDDPYADIIHSDRTDKITLTLGRHTTTNPMLPEGDTYEDNAYIRMAEDVLNIDIVDEFEGSNEDYTRQVSLTVSAGSMPDVMKILTQAELTELWENDMIMDLTDLFDSCASQGLKDVYATYPEGLGLDRGKIDGHLAAIPAAGGDCAPMICFVRQDWLDQLGITMDADNDRVVSYTEIIDVAKQFMEANPEGVDNPVGIASIPDLAWREGEGAWALNFISNAMNAWPQTWYVKDGKPVWGSTTEETKEWLRYCNELYNEGILDPQVGVRQWDDVTALMTNGQFGFAFGAGHTPNWGLVNVYSLNDKCQYSGFLISDENGIVRHKHSDSAEQGMIVISKDCKNPEAAIEILNLFYGTSVDLDNYLYEKYPEFKEYETSLGVDHSCRPYNISIGRYDSTLESARLRDAYFKGEMTMDEVLAIKPSLENNIKSIEAYMNGETKEPAEWARYTANMVGYSLSKVLDEYPKAEWVTPLFPSTTETMKTNWANLTALEAETFIKIVTGAVDVDEGFDNFVAQWKAQGGDQICEEVATQFGLN